MSYQEKYFKYKNKYLDLKSKFDKMQVNNFSEQSSIFLNPKDNNLIGGNQLNTTITEKTENTQLESDSISSLFIQSGGRGRKVNVESKQMKTSKQFIQNKSDSDLASSSTLVSSSTISDNSDSDFLSE
jgi:hypothetical protein